MTVSVIDLPSRVLLAGCGDLGIRLGLLLVARSHEVLALRRDPSRLPKGFRPLAADLATGHGLRALPSAVEATVYLASADGFDEDSYRRAYAEGPARLLDAVAHPGRLVFVSSTSVFAQDDGSWVNEESEVSTEGFSRRHLLAGERLVREAGGTVLRLAGLYGPGRTRLLDSVRAGRASFVEGEDEWTNRIHADDAARALLALLELAEPEDLYLGVDDEPARRREVLEWLAARMGAPAPLPESARTGARPRSNKRCSNRRLRAAGWQPAWPSFREGYSALLDASS